MFPCNSDHPDVDKPFRNGIMRVSDIPDTYAAFCRTSQNSYISVEWSGFGALNGVYVWNTHDFVLPICTTSHTVTVYDSEGAIVSTVTRTHNIGIIFSCNSAVIIDTNTGSPISGTYAFFNEILDPTVYCLARKITPNLVANAVYQGMLNCYNIGPATGSPYFPIYLGTVETWMSA